jgi:hypothetical protein
MQRGPQVSGYGNQINQITGKIPLYKPNDKGDMLLRILPAFEQGQELPWVDFELGSSDDNSGLGNQHFPISAVCVFRDKSMSWLSAKSKESDDDQESSDSPATFVAKRVQAMIKKAVQLKKAGYTNINDNFLPNPFDGSWISITQMNLVQALLFKVSGANVRDRDGNPFRYGIVDLTNSGFGNLTKYLFSPRIADASGHARATGVHDSKFGDYCSCADGNFVILRRDPTKATKVEYDIMLSTPPEGWDSGSLDQAWAASQFRPWWSDAENSVYKMPTHEQVFDALEQIVPMDILGFGLIDTPFETMLTPNMVDLGRNIQLTKADIDQPDPDQGRGNARSNVAQAQAQSQGQSQAQGQGPRPQSQPQQQQQQVKPPPFKPIPGQSVPQSTVPAKPAITRAPGPAAIAGAAATVNRGPQAPQPPSRPGAKAAFPGPIRQPLQGVPKDMEQLPHLGQEEENTFMDPALVTADGEAIPTVEL